MHIMIRVGKNSDLKKSKNRIFLFKSHFLFKSGFLIFKNLYYLSCQDFTKFLILVCLLNHINSLFVSSGPTTKRVGKVLRRYCEGPLFQRSAILRVNSVNVIHLV